ncbi:hypothetical protein LSAT2_000203, partial [Lamellibrachia satsuma]
MTDRGPRYFVRDRTIRPSKEGYHPRSLSATFKRLTKVKERLESELECSGDLRAFSDSNLDIKPLKYRQHLEYENKKETRASCRDSLRAPVCTCHQASSNVATSNGYTMWRIPHQIRESSDETRTCHSGQHDGYTNGLVSRHVRQISRDRTISKKVGPVKHVATPTLSDAPHHINITTDLSRQPLSKKMAVTANVENGGERKWELHVTLPSADTDWVD